VAITLGILVIILAKESPLDRLDPAAIPLESRTPELPPQAVAVIGNPGGRPWGAVMCIAFAHDGRHMVTGGTDGCVRVCDAATLRHVSVTTDCGDIRSLAVSADGKWLVVASWPYKSAFELPGPAYGWLQLFEWTGDHFAPRNKCFLNNGSVACVAFAPDGKTVAAAMSATGPQLPRELRSEKDKDLPGSWVRLLHVTDDKLEPGEDIAGNQDQGTIWSVAFSHDGQKLAVGGRSSGVELWDISGAPSPDLNERWRKYYASRKVLVPILESCLGLIVFTVLAGLIWERLRNRSPQVLTGERADGPLGEVRNSASGGSIPVAAVIWIFCGILIVILLGVGAELLSNWNAVKSLPGYDTPGKIITHCRRARQKEQPRSPSHGTT
jgi:hypothetical protein